MHLRRALLLFAIVLGLAALATSISRPDDDEGKQSPSGSAQQPQVVPGNAEAPPPDGPAGTQVRFAPGRRLVLRTIEPGQAATVLVEVNTPSLVELEGLGLSDSAEPDTPASFEVLESSPGSFDVLVTAVGGNEQTRLGTLRVSTSN